MDIQKLREALGLSAAQVADEFNLPKQDVLDCEETGAAYLFARYVAVFPVNPALLKNADAEPLLEGTDRSFPGNRLKSWREENGISVVTMAETMEMTTEELLRFENDPAGRINRLRGETFEKKTGISRKWLMYGDARNKGVPIIRSTSDQEDRSSRDRPIRDDELNREGAERVRKAREEAGMSRKELSELIGLSMSRISQIESGYVKESKVNEILDKIGDRHQNDESPKAVGAKIRAARKKSGLTIRQAAEMAGLKPASLTHMESGYVTAKRADEVIRAFMKTTESPAENSAGKDYGATIRDERKQAGLSQKELATILRVPVSRVGEMEMGNVTPAQAEEILRRIRGGPRRIQGNTPKIKPTRKVLLGRKIRDSRQSAGLSQRDAGALIGVNQGRFSMIEKGEVDDTTANEILRKIEEYLIRTSEESGQEEEGNKALAERNAKRKK